MQVTIKLLNVYRQYLPDHARGSSYSLHIPPGTRVDALLAQLPLPSDEKKVVLLNGSAPPLDRVLADGDVIAVFPAMAGG